MSVATILIVSKMGNVTAAEHAYRAMIHEIPVGEIDERKQRLTLGLSKCLMAAGLLAIVVMIVFSARPYAEAQNASALEAGIEQLAPDSIGLEHKGENER